MGFIDLLTDEEDDSDLSHCTNGLADSYVECNDDDAVKVLECITIGH